MPIYEYVCNECGHEFETLQKMSDAPLGDCPECKKSALKKKISAPGFRLSGSGWYETDFKSDNQRNLHEGGDNKDSGDNKDDVGKKDSGDKKPKDSKSAGDGTKKSKTDGNKSSPAKSTKSNKNQPASAA